MKSILTFKRKCFVIFTLLTGIFAFGQIPPTDPNPNVGPNCPLTITLVLDESGSIGSAGFAEVRTAVINFMTALNGTGAQLALVRFSNNSVRMTINGSQSFQTIDASFIASATVALNTTYGFVNSTTNWAAAFNDALAINNEGLPASIVIFFTDGNPVPTNVSPYGNQLISCINTSNTLKGQGSHIFMLGVGNGITLSNLQAVSGTTPAPPIISADYNIEEDFTGVQTCLLALANSLNTAFYPDSDGDGFGDVNGTPIVQCDAPIGYVANNLDCDDGNSNINPNALDVCDGLDNDCDGFVDNGIDSDPPVFTNPSAITVFNDLDQCGAKVCYPFPTATDACPPATPSGFTYLTQVGNSYYYISNLQYNFVDAQALAAASGGHLAVITSQTENDALTLANAGFAWMGGNDLAVDGTWEWSNCEPFAYSNFAAIEPNGGTFENHLEFMIGGQWNDLGELGSRYALLEIEGVSIIQTAGLPQGAVFPIGTTTNIFVATDAAGNTSTSSFDITVNDSTPPEANAANLTLYLDEFGNASIGEGDYSVGPIVGSLNAQNSSSVSMDISCDCPAGFVAVGYEGFAGCIVDNVRLVCKKLNSDGTLGAATAVTCSSGSGSTTPFSTSLAGDEVLVGFEVTDANYDFFGDRVHLGIQGIGKSIAEIALDDANNNNTTALTGLIGGGCYSNSPVTTTEFAPDGNVIVGFEANSQGYSSIIKFHYAPIGSVTLLNNGSSDNCAIASIVPGQTQFTCANLGVNSVSLVVTDQSGNSSTTLGDVIVNDSTPPNLSIQDAVITLLGGTATVPAALLDLGSTDNCGIVNIAVSPETFTCNEIGDNTVNVTVSDNSGNSRSTTATVSVVGEIPSCSINSVPSNAINNGFGDYTIVLGYGAQSTTLDATALGGSGFTYSWSGNTALLSCSNCEDPVFTPTAGGAETYVLTVTNQYGCTSTCSITIDVVDATCGKSKNPKVIICHNGHEICVSANAVPAHLSNHSEDRLGACTHKNGFVNAALNVYPSPNAGSFYVEFEINQNENVQIEVYSSVGQLVYTEKVTDSPGHYIHNINLEHVSNGVYMVRISANGTTELQRIQIQK